jgi:hypothetical protein
VREHLAIPDAFQRGHPVVGGATAGPSPDGRWLAYASDESGAFEVYVQAVQELTGHASQSPLTVIVNWSALLPKQR